MVGSREQSRGQEPEAGGRSLRPGPGAGGLPRDPGRPSLLFLGPPPLGFLPSPSPEGAEPALPLTSKASRSRSRMLDESSCSTPSEETGKYEDSFCRRGRGAQTLTSILSRNPGNSSGVHPLFSFIYFLSF